MGRILESLGMTAAASLLTRRAALAQTTAGACASLLAPRGWTAAPSPWPPSIALDYAISGLRGGIQISARGNLDWRRNTRAYEARLGMVAFIVFKREQLSRGMLTQHGVQPRYFEDRKQRSQVANFDAQRGHVQYGNGAHREWPAHGQDRVSMLMALWPLLQQALAKGEQRITLPVSGAQNWSLWTMDIQGRETITTPSGPWPTWRLARSDSGAAEQKTLLWLAPSLHGLPVRLLVTEPNGDTADQRLNSHKRLDDLPSA